MPRGYQVQMLMTAEVRAKLPALYANEDKPVEDAVVQVRFFHAYGAGEWLITEFDGEDTLFGYCDLGMGCGEWGYASLAELTGLRARIGGRRMPFQAIERDICFKPTRFGDLKKAA